MIEKKLTICNREIFCSITRKILECNMESCYKRISRVQNVLFIFENSKFKIQKFKIRKFQNQNEYLKNLYRF